MITPLTPFPNSCVLIDEFQMNMTAIHFADEHDGYTLCVFSWECRGSQGVMSTWRKRHTRGRPQPHVRCSVLQRVLQGLLQCLLEYVTLEDDCNRTCIVVCCSVYDAVCLAVCAAVCVAAS